MSRIPSNLGTTPRDQSFATTDAINDIDLGTFLEIMIAELQNQDPLNPLDNKDMLAQISQLREVGATDKLTETLESVLLGQNIASATSLIGADIDALSDDNQPISGTVSRVSLEDGDPKLHLDLGVSAEPSIESGDIEKGTYAYRVVWQNAEGKLEGMELSGPDAISTDSILNDYQSIRLRNLPPTPGPKAIYRTDASGIGDYRLVTTLTDGTQSTYLDTVANESRSETRQFEPFNADPKHRARTFKVSLRNVGEIRRPGADDSLATLSNSSNLNPILRGGESNGSTISNDDGIDRLASSRDDDRRRR
jgi:flagellar basal-body rod modification protein FlgD